MKFGKIALVVAALAMVSACSGMNRQEQRALSCGAIGAAGGVAVGLLTGGSSLLGGLIGGAGGAAVGALTK
jgi:hypothetical protein